MTLVQATLVQQAILLEEQARDDRGRFASGGSSTGGAARKDPHISGGSLGIERTKRLSPDQQRKAAHTMRRGDVGAKLSPWRFTGQGKIGAGPQKMSVMSKQRVRDIFSKAGHAVGYAAEAVIS